MTALKILIRTITDIYRNPRFLIFVVGPVYLAITVIVVSLQLLQNGSGLGIVQPETALLIFAALAALAAVTTIFLLTSMAIGWHRLILAPHQYPTLWSAMSNQPRWRYLARTAPLFIMILIIAGALSTPAIWAIEQYLFFSKTASHPLILRSGIFFIDHGTTLLIQGFWVLLGLGLPCVALGQKDRWRTSAGLGLRNAGTLILCLCPVLVISVLGEGLISGLCPPYEQSCTFSSLLAIDIALGFWTGLVALIMLGLITRGHQQLIP